MTLRLWRCACRTRFRSAGSAGPAGSMAPAQRSAPAHQQIDDRVAGGLVAGEPHLGGIQPAWQRSRRAMWVEVECVLTSWSSTGGQPGAALLLGQQQPPYSLAWIHDLDPPTHPPVIADANNADVVGPALKQALVHQCLHRLQGRSQAQQRGGLRVSPAAACPHPPMPAMHACTASGQGSCSGSWEAPAAPWPSNRQQAPE